MTDLTLESLEKAISEIREMEKNQGEILSIKPTHIDLQPILDFMEAAKQSPERATVERK